jgi:hypothetical protein
MLCGIWGALVPFIGPYFHFAYSPDVTWHWTWARFWLEVLPGIGAFVGGFLLTMSGNRATAVLGGWIASLAGAWFVTGPALSMLWHHGPGYVGQPVGGNTHQSMEQIAFFYGIGALTLFLGAMSLGRLSVHSVRDVRHAERRMAMETAVEEPVVEQPMVEQPVATSTTAAPAAAGAMSAERTPVHDGTMVGRGTQDTRAMDDTRAMEESRGMDDTRVDHPAVYPEEPAGERVEHPTGSESR